MFLTQDELQELTAFKIPSKQIQWLKAEGFLFRVAADGHPRVLRSAVEELMGAPETKKNARVVTPEFGEFI